MLIVVVKIIYYKDKIWMPAIHLSMCYTLEITLQSSRKLLLRGKYGHRSLFKKCLTPILFGSHLIFLLHYIKILMRLWDMIKAETS